MKPITILVSAAVLAISVGAANSSPNERDHKGEDHSYGQQDQREAHNRKEAIERDDDRAKLGERKESHKRYDRDDEDDDAGKRREYDRD